MGVALLRENTRLVSRLARTFGNLALRWENADRAPASGADSDSGLSRGYLLLGYAGRNEGKRRLAGPPSPFNSSSVLPLGAREGNQSIGSCEKTRRVSGGPWAEHYREHLDRRSGPGRSVQGFVRQMSAEWGLESGGWQSRRAFQAEARSRSRVIESDRVVKSVGVALEHG